MNRASPLKRLWDRNSNNMASQQNERFAGEQDPAKVWNIIPPLFISLDQKKGTVLACVLCRQVVLEIKKQILEKGQSFRDLEGDIEFRTTTCQACRDIIVRIPKVERTGVILIPARERPVAHDPDF
jgi:hypothetical protein